MLANLQLIAVGVALLASSAGLVAFLVVVIAFALGLPPPPWAIEVGLWGIGIAVGSYAVGWVAARLED